MRLAAAALLFGLGLGEDTPEQGEDTGDELRISALSVRLPAGAQYVLHAFPSEECFRWSTNRKDLLELNATGVAGQGHGCSPSVTITAKTPMADGVQSAKVIAEVGGQQHVHKALRCDVYIDAVARIAIRRTQSKLNVGCERLVRVDAKDAVGNTFSSLEGLPFSWRAQGAEGAEGAACPANSGCTPRSHCPCGAIKPLLIDDSAQKSTHKRQQLETSFKLQTDHVVLYAAGAGSTTMTVEMDNSTGMWQQKSAVAAAQVGVDVVEPLLLLPEHQILVVQGSCFAYRLSKQLQCGDVEDALQMPHSQYKWDSSDTAVVVVNSEWGSVTATGLGIATIAVRDALGAGNDGEGVVSVVEPDAIEIGIPGSTRFQVPTTKTPEPEPYQKPRIRSDHDGVWHLVRGTEYTFHTLLFDDAGTQPGERPGSRRPIFIADNVEVTPALETDRGWDIVIDDHQSVTATPTTIGPAAITVTFAGVKVCSAVAGTTDEVSNEHYHIHEPYNRDTPLTMVQKVHVQEAVSIDLPWKELVLPRPQELPEPNRHPLKAIGGSGTYLWSSSDTSVATVDADGVVTAVAEGAAVIRCQDRWNADNFDSRQVVVSRITSLSLARAPKEVEVGSTLMLGAVLRDGQGRSFDSCFPASFDMQVGSQSIFSTTATSSTVANLAYGRFPDPQHDQAVIGEAEACDPALEVGRKACFVMDLRGEAEGESEVMLTMSGRGLSLGAKLTYAAFTPLVILSPLEHKAVATIGCQSQVSFRGGPRWLAPREVVAVEPATQARAVHVQEIDAKAATRKYVATCTAIGDQSLAVRVGNQLSCAERAEYAPTLKVEHISLKCAVPQSIELAPLGYHGTLSETRELWQTNPDAVRMCTATEHLVSVVAYTGEGRSGDRFTNASSLEVNWSVTPHSDSSPVTSEPVESTWGEMTVVHTDPEATPDSTATVAATVHSYADWVPPELLEIVQTDSAGLRAGLTDSLPLLFLTAPRFDSAHRTLYAHPDNEIHLMTYGGSGLFDFTVADKLSPISDLASIGYVKPQSPAAPWPRPTAKLSLHTPCEAEGLTVHLSDAGTIGVGDVQMKVSLSHLYGLSLATPLQCELGREATASALALTKFGEEIFELDQTALMGLELRHSNASVAVSQPSADHAGQFKLDPLCVGALNLTLSAQPTGPPATVSVCGPGAGSDEAQEIPSVSAAPVEVGVYVPLTCLPASISLVTGASAQVLCVAGPSGVVNKTYSVISEMHEDVVTVDRHGVVTAKAVGSALIRTIFETTGTASNPSAIAVADVPVEVLPLDAIKIRSDVNWLEPGTQASVHVEGSAGQSPISLADLSTECSWSSQDVAVIEMMPPKEPSNIAALSSRLTAKAVGQSRIQVFCIVRGPGSARNLSHEIEMHVEPPLALVGSPTLLLRPGSRAEIRTNRPTADLRFRVVGSSLGVDEDATAWIHVDTTSTQGSAEQALVMASADAPTGLTVYLAIECERGGVVQALLVTVEVRTLHAVHWRFLDNFTDPHNVLALGSSLTLAVELSDKAGRSFAPLVVREAALHYEMSHSNVKLLTSWEDDGSGRPGTRVTLTGMSLGACVVSVVVGEDLNVPSSPRCAPELGRSASSKTKPINPPADYLQLSVINMIEPQTALHVGAAARFSLVPGAEDLFPLLKMATEYRWRSAQRHVLDLIGETQGEDSSVHGGYAHAGEHASEVEVHLEAVDGSNEPVWATRTHMFVSRITNVTIGKATTTLSDASGSHDFVPVQFYGIDAAGQTRALGNIGREDCAAYSVHDKAEEDESHVDAGACVDQRILFTCSSADTDFVSDATAVYDRTSDDPYRCKLTYNSQSKVPFPPTLGVSVVATDHGSSYSITQTNSFEFVGAFDLQPSESINLWPAQPNLTVEVLRARRPITARVEEEAASWGLFATPVPGSNGAWLVGVGAAAWRAEFSAAPSSFESTIVFECAEIEQTQTLKVHWAHASYQRPVDAMIVGQEIEGNNPQLPGGLATRGFIVQPDLPDGLHLDSDTGVIEGMPTTPTPTDDGAPQRFTVWVDAGEQSLELKLAILVQPAAGSSWFSWLSMLLATGVAGVVALNIVGEQQHSDFAGTPAKFGQTGPHTAPATAREGHLQHVAASPFRPLAQG